MKALWSLQMNRMEKAELDTSHSSCEMSVLSVGDIVIQNFNTTYACMGDDKPNSNSWWKILQLSQMFPAIPCVLSFFLYSMMQIFAYLE